MIETFRTEASGDDLGSLSDERLSCCKIVAIRADDVDHTRSQHIQCLAFCETAREKTRIYLGKYSAVEKPSPDLLTLKSKIPVETVMHYRELAAAKLNTATASDES